MVDHAERVAGLGSWEWVPATGELRWSDNLYRLYGVEPGELDPSAELVLERIHPSDRERIRAELDALSAGERRTFEYRFEALDGEHRMLRATVATMEGAPGEDLRVVGSVFDVTERRRLERELAMWLGVTEALDRWSSLAVGAPELLRAIAGPLNAEFGAFWVPEGGHCTARATWQLDAGPQFDAVAQATLAWHPGPGSPTIGAALAGGDPVISSQVDASVPPPRAAALRAADLSCVVAVPVLGDGVLAVLEVLGRGPIDTTERLRRALRGIAHEVGRFLAPRRGELTAQLLTEREITVLQLAARGYDTAAIAAELHLSPATVKRHFERTYARLDVRDRSAAVAEAMRRGWIE